MSQNPRCLLAHKRLFRSNEVQTYNYENTAIQKENNLWGKITAVIHLFKIISKEF